MVKLKNNDIIKVIIVYLNVWCITTTRSMYDSSQIIEKIFTRQEGNTPHLSTIL